MLRRYLQKMRNNFQIYRHRRYVLSAVKGGLNLGKNVTIMDGVSFDPPHNALISIGDNTTIGPGVLFIAHDASTFKRLNISRLGEIVIGCDCFVGSRSIFLPGVTVGANVIIGAGSVISKDIPSNCLAAGNPGIVIKQYEEFFEQRKQLARENVCFEYEKFYQDVKGNLLKMEKQNTNRKMFFTTGQVSEVRKAFRFNL